MSEEINKELEEYKKKVSDAVITLTKKIPRFSRIILNCFEEVI